MINLTAKLLIYLLICFRHVDWIQIDESSHCCPVLNTTELISSSLLKLHCCNFLLTTSQFPMTMAGVEAHDSGWRWAIGLLKKLVVCGVALSCHQWCWLVLLCPILLLQLIVVFVVVFLCRSFCYLCHACCSWNASQTVLLFCWWLCAHWNQMRHHAVLLPRLPAAKLLRLRESHCNA